MSELIDRQAAIDALDFEIVHMTAYCDGKNEDNPLAQYNKGLEDGKKAIEALPPAQPEPKEGHWIWVAGELMCSECRTIYSDLYPDYDNAVACPHCGTKMTTSTK